MCERILNVTQNLPNERMDMLRFIFTNIFYWLVLLSWDLFYLCTNKMRFFLFEARAEIMKKNQWGKKYSSRGLYWRTYCSFQIWWMKLWFTFIRISQAQLIHLAHISHASFSWTILIICISRYFFCLQKILKVNVLIHRYNLLKIILL